MMVLAHILAVPVEEVLTPLAGGAGAGVLFWLSARISGLVKRRLRHNTAKPLE